MQLLILLTTLIGVTLGNDWAGHKTKFSLKFSTTTEESDRQAIWTQNMDVINRHNQKAFTDSSVTYKMGANQFTHLRHDEFISQHTGYVRNENFNTHGGNVQVTRPSRARRALTTTASGCTCTCSRVI